MVRVSEGQTPYTQSPGRRRCCRREGRRESGKGNSFLQRSKVTFQRAQQDELQAKGTACTKAQTEKGPLV